MAAMRGPRVQVGSAAWVGEERSSALQIVESEVEEFSYSARNEMDWLNEHMAGIFDENETNFADTFKTPGKLRGKTPRTARRPVAAEVRVPLSDVFAATPNVPSSHFSPRTNRIKSPQILRDAATSSPEIQRSPSPRKLVAFPRPKDPQPDTQDSGYYGSQDIAQGSQSFREAPGLNNHIGLHTTTQVPIRLSPIRAYPADSPEKTSQTAREEQTTRPLGDRTAKLDEDDFDAAASGSGSQTSSPVQQLGGMENQVLDGEPDVAGPDDGDVDAEMSASESSSPVRPMVRKSSMNFASLPAREPLPAGKANPGRVSRVSHLDPNRMSYYGRPTEGKSLGNAAGHDSDEMNENDVATTENAPPGKVHINYEDLAADHHKTYTQRLQDQISMLGKSQPHGERPSKPVSEGSVSHKPVTKTTQAAQTPKSPSPPPLATLKSTPGAFPEDDDDWIEPPVASPEIEAEPSPRPGFPKSYSTDIMDGLHDGIAAGEPRAMLSPLHRQTVHDTERPVSAFAAPSLEKAATITDLRSGPPAALLEPAGAPISPIRNYRDSPLKQVKNKLSSIFKSSKALMASGAALSAEGKVSAISPSMTRLAHFSGLSMESLAEKPETARDSPLDSQLVTADASPTRPVGKRTRASIEKEREEKKRDKETKRMEEQQEKLEKARAQVRERARDFTKEKELLETQHLPLDKETVLVQKTPKTTRSSPRKPMITEENTAKQSEGDIDMVDAPSTIPQPPPRTLGPSASKPRELKRPIKPVKETLSKPRQAPTVIRVNTGSQHSQYLTSSSVMAAASTEQDSTAQLPQTQLMSKASKASLQSKPSTQSLRAAASAGRAKALDAAAKKKEQDEREALRRREAKAELEKKRLVAQEEQRRIEQTKRQEAERQKQKEREQATQAEAKKSAQRQAAIEKAKQTRAPPPAVRSHTPGAQEYTPHQDKRASTLISSKGEGSRPPSRLTSGLPRSQEEIGRPTTSHVSKLGTKRTLPMEAVEDPYRAGASRNGTAYQSKDAKRRRTSDEFDEDHESDSPPNIKGPPVRPSGGFKKDIPTKPAYPTNYPTAPQSAKRENLFKATVTNQHQSQTRSAHPFEMAQVSKGAIPFAPSANAAKGHPTKTPVRTAAANAPKASAAKSAAKSSPKFPNGEAIELPEIQTDDEDDEDEPSRGMYAQWADSPELRKQLLYQDRIDPGEIFGPPRPLDMEEVFFKSKEKFHKFRSRTSSANWTGADRLTEEDIRKDLAARDKLRREGGWTYEMSKNLL
ncbi:hypothetical protein NLU13_0541 [Sarocladium strictum]|uniref:Inner centromere protein ARK-binding domain-containing protein n=1 Tax=Sarocladium strictum TaxID=5046 RepID=A0AA39LBL4_SARSR|nr:hypothetical protein NLU13_0541 [Sarocladium strictum]